MRIVWKDFKEQYVLDRTELKRINYTAQIEELFEAIDAEEMPLSFDPAAPSDQIAQNEDMLRLIVNEKAHVDNEHYYDNFARAQHLFSLICKMPRGVYFRLEDGRQLGPFKSVETFLEQAGEDAILLSYGLEEEPRVHAKSFPVPGRAQARPTSFSKAVLESKKMQLKSVLPLVAPDVQKRLDELGLEGTLSTLAQNLQKSPEELSKNMEDIIRRIMQKKEETNE